MRDKKTNFFIEKFKSKIDSLQELQIKYSKENHNELISQLEMERPNFNTPIQKNQSTQNESHTKQPPIMD